LAGTTIIGFCAPCCTSSTTTTGTTGTTGTDTTATTGTGTGTGCCDVWGCEVQQGDVCVSLELSNFAACSCWIENPENDVPLCGEGVHRNRYEGAFVLCNMMVFDYVITCTGDNGPWTLDWTLISGGVGFEGCDYSGTESEETPLACGVDPFLACFKVSDIPASDCCGGGVGVGYFDVCLKPCPGGTTAGG